LKIEICVEGVRSALAAGRGGADRVELCENLAVGGVTPSAGAIRVARAGLDAALHVLIRPRGGDFAPDADEFEAMRHDVARARELGADGVVLGLLTPDGRVDRERTARLVEAARPLSVTFHRAFDATLDAGEALDVLIGLGLDRVLTTGGASRAREGLAGLAGLLRRAAGRIGVLAGGGVGLGDLPALAALGLAEAHVGSAASGPGGATDETEVARLVRAARRLVPGPGGA
jgi:copper homeostasis protein